MYILTSILHLFSQRVLQTRTSYFKQLEITFVELRYVKKLMSYSETDFAPHTEMRFMWLLFNACVNRNLSCGPNNLYV